MKTNPLLHAALWGLFAIVLELALLAVVINSLRPAPVCIVVHASGVPAPASCSNPDSYQVTP